MITLLKTCMKVAGYTRFKIEPRLGGGGSYVLRVYKTVIGPKGFPALWSVCDALRIGFGPCGPQFHDIKWDGPFGDFDLTLAENKV